MKEKNWLSWLRKLPESIKKRRILPNSPLKSADSLPSPDFYQEEIENHFGHLFPSFGSEGHVWHELLSPLFHLDIYIIDPSGKFPCYTLFTTGMSCLPMKVGEGTPERRRELERAELMMFLPKEFPMNGSQKPETIWPMRLLQSLTRFPHENQTWFGGGHSIGPYDRPLAPDTEQCGCVFWQQSGDLGKLVTRDGTVINFYLVIPLYPEEIKYKLSCDVNASWQMLQDLPLIVDLQRPSLVPQNIGMPD